MAKISIAGNAAVITSAIKLEDYKTIAKYRPSALVLMGGEEEDKIPVFMIGISDSGEGCINNNGALFSHATRDDAKLATVTMVINGVDDEEDIKEFVADELGNALMNLNALEAKLPEVLDEITVERANVLDSITVTA